MITKPIHILSTRRINSQLKKEAHEKGFLIEEKDFLKFSYSLDKTISEQIQMNSSPFVFTSKHAIKGITELLDKYNFTLKTNTCFCIEGATSEAAKKAGFIIKGTAKNARTLAEKIVDEGEQAVLHCTTKQRRYELSQILETAKIKTDDCEVYDKQMVHLKVSAFEGVLLFSPSRFDAFTACNELLADIPVFCIGNTTAGHAANCNHKNIIIAEQANETAILDSVYSYFNKTNG